MDSKRWLIVPTSVTGSINFNEVLESDIDSLRLSIDGSKTFVKYHIVEITSSFDIKVPNPEDNTETTETISSGVYGRPSIYNNSYPEYTLSEIKNILTGSEWVSGSLSASN
jgi:hypothetical protein